MRQALKTSALKYITSERFIHDDLLRDGAKLVEKLYDLWRKERKIRPSLLLFPSDYVIDDVGRGINGVISMELDKEPDHRRAIVQAVERTKAYAFFYVRTEGDEVRALLESPHGTREWVLPVRRSGDVLVLLTASSKDNQGLEILYSHKQGRS
jgi:hypothetical protein